MNKNWYCYYIKNVPKRSEIYSLYYDALKRKYSVFIKKIYDAKININGTSFYSSDAELKIAGIYILTNDPTHSSNI